jgi:hypothetical protein
MAWKLKWIDRARGQQESTVALGQQLHHDWSVIFEESLVLGRWIRYLAVLITSAMVVFLLLHPVDVPLQGLLSVSLRNNGLQLVVLAGFTFRRDFMEMSRHPRRGCSFGRSVPWRI